MSRPRGQRPRSKQPYGNEKAERNQEIVRLYYQSVFKFTEREIARAMGISVYRVYYILKREVLRPQ